MLGPSRCEPAQDVEEAAHARQLDCANAKACLTVADKNAWPAFRCGHGCYVPLDVVQRSLDHEGLTLLRLLIDRGER